MVATGRSLLQKFADRTLQLKRLERSVARNQNDWVIHRVSDGVEREVAENGLKVACASQRLPYRTRIG